MNIEGQMVFQKGHRVWIYYKYGIDFTVPTGGADLRFLALQPGSAWGVGASHPVLSHTLPVYFPQIFPGIHLELGRLWLSLQSRTTDPRPEPNNWV